MIHKELGILNNNPQKKHKREISLLSKEIRDSIEREKLDGLCLPRFYENLTIEGLDASKVTIGENLKIGETVQQVIGVGKRCFKECKLVQAKEMCELSTSVVFTTVIKGGIIKIDDEVSSLGY